MKNIRKRIFSFFTTGILLFSLVVSAFGAETSASTFGFILPDDLRVPSEQSFRADDTGIKEMRKFLNGTIGAYITDLDSDGKQEMIDVFLRSSESSDTTQIRIGLYEKGAEENTVLRQEFMLSEFHSSMMFDYSFKMSYFESDAGKYLICNEIMGAGAGISSTASMMTLDDNNMLYAPVSLLDQGYTSGIGLGRVDNTPASQLAQVRFAEGTILYSWNAGDSGEPSSQAYYSALNQSLAPYGTSAAVSPICGAYLADTPFIIQGETAIVAELQVKKVAYGYHNTIHSVKFNGNDPFTVEEHRVNSKDGLVPPEDILTPNARAFEFCNYYNDGEHHGKLFSDGIIGAYIEDLDCNGSKEMVAVYLKQDEPKDKWQIRLRIYANNESGQTVCRQDFCLRDDFYSMGLHSYDFDFRLYYYENQGKRYLISDVEGSGDIVSVNVFSMNDGVLQEEISLYNPGFPASLWLYQTINSNLSDISSHGTEDGVQLFDIREEQSDFYQKYYQIINEKLEVYEIKVLQNYSNDDETVPTSFVFNGESNVVASVMIHPRNRIPNYASYNGHNPFACDASSSESDDNQNNRPFNPETFYHNILNDQRPSYAVDSNGYAAGYRFLDLDADGKEELLLCGGSLNHAWAPIRAVYTSKPDSDEPVLLDLRLNPYDGGEQGCRISYTDGIGGTVLYSSMADLLPMSIQVLYRLSAGALIPICGFAEKTGSDRVFYTENADYLAEPGKYDYIEWDVGTQSDSKVSEMKALIEKTHDIKPYLCSCVNYDAQQEYQKNHPETIIPVSGASGYDALLRKIRGIAAAPHRIESEGFGTSSLSTDNFSHLWLEYYLQGMLTNPCFVLRDLNSDGTPELAVGNRLEDGNFELFDLYTIFDGEIVHLASSVNRDRFSIGVNNEIVEVDFPSAQYNTKIAYELKNGKLEPKRALQVDYMTYYSLDNGGTSAESWREITQSDYIEKSDTEYPVLQNPEMIDLLTWNEGSAVSGDFNGDDTVSVADAVLLARFVAEDETLSDEQIDLILKAQPDQDSDGIVTISDVLYTLKYCCI